MPTWKPSAATIAGYPCVETTGARPEEIDLIIVCRNGEVSLLNEDTFIGVALNADAAAPLIEFLRIPPRQRHYDGTIPFSFPRQGDLLAQVTELLGGPLSGQEAADKANEAMDEGSVGNA